MGRALPPVGLCAKRVIIMRYI